MPTLLFLLLPLSILNTWVRLFGFGSHSLEGTPVATTPIPLLARIFMHARRIAISIITAILLAAFDIMPWWLVIAPIISGAILLAVPLRYTLTNAGFKRTFGPFRRWTEFAGVERAPGGARLKPLPRTRQARIWLSGSRGDDEFLQLMRTLIRNAYQGRGETWTPQPAEPSPDEQSSVLTSKTPPMAAFKQAG